MVNRSGCMCFEEKFFVHLIMDVDSELDGSLLQQFSCLGTTDRDVLISQLQKLLGNQLNAAGCAFFLDMNNWNLQAAICSYFDFEAPRDRLPHMTFIKDITIGEGEAVPPCTKFIKTWRIQNCGEEQWPLACCLKFTSGDHLGHQERVLVEPLKPQECTDVSVEMVSPQRAGIYQGQWRMCTATGHCFGEIIWVILSVQEGGLLGVTQQMEAFHQLGSPPRNPQHQANPFASPTTTCEGDRVTDFAVSSLCQRSCLPLSPVISTFQSSVILSSSPIHRLQHQAENTLPCQHSSTSESSGFHHTNDVGAEEMTL